MFLFFCSLFDGMDPVASSFPRLPPAWLGSFSSPPHGTEQPMHVRPFKKKNQNRQISAASLRPVPPRISSSSPLPAASSTVAYPIGGHRRMLRCTAPCRHGFDSTGPVPSWCARSSRKSRHSFFSQWILFPVSPQKNSGRDTWLLSSKETGR